MGVSRRPRSSNGSVNTLLTPQSSTLTTTMSEFKLFCWVLTKSNAPFSVTIGKEMTVDELKDKIKEKMKPVLDNVVVANLLLWKVSGCIDRCDLANPNDCKISTPDDETVNDESLSELIKGKILPRPSKKLSKVFKDDPPKDDYIHIVAKLPSSGTCSDLTIFINANFACPCCSTIPFIPSCIAFSRFAPTVGPFCH
jgi:hypothetical protein